MPNYALSELAKAQAILNANFANPELRFRTPQAFNYLTAQSNIMMPDYEALRTSEKRAVEAYYILRDPQANQGVRVHNHTGPNGDSGVLAPTWATESRRFVHTLKTGTGASNIITGPEALAGKIQNRIADFADGLEQLAADFLFNNRTGVNNAAANGTFNGVNEVFEISGTLDGNKTVQVTKSMMRQNKYSGQIVVFADSVAFKNFGFDSQQGPGNNENLAFQYSGVQFIESIEMDALAVGLGYSDGFWIAVQVGTVAALPWIPMENRMGHEDSEGMYGNIINPADGLTYAVHTYKERIDGTALGTETQDVKTEWELSIDLAFDHAPLSVANETPILACAIV